MNGDVFLLHYNMDDGIFFHFTIIRVWCFLCSVSLWMCWKDQWQTTKQSDMLRIWYGLTNTRVCVYVCGCVCVKKDAHHAQWWGSFFMSITCPITNQLTFFVQEGGGKKPAVKFSFIFQHRFTMDSTQGQDFDDGKDAGRWMDVRCGWVKHRPLWMSVTAGL